MTKPSETLVPGFKTDDSYGWLNADPSYQLPADWIAGMPVPEIHASRIIAAFDEEGYGRTGQFMLPLACGK